MTLPKESHSSLEYQGKYMVHSSIVKCIFNTVEAVYIQYKGAGERGLVFIEPLLYIQHVKKFTQADLLHIHKDPIKCMFYRFLKCIQQIKKYS